MDFFRRLKLDFGGNKEDQIVLRLLLLLLILAFALPKSDENLVSQVFRRTPNKFMPDKTSDKRLTWTLYRKGYLSRSIYILYNFQLFPGLELSDVCSASHRGPSQRENLSRLFGGRNFVEYKNKNQFHKNQRINTLVIIKEPIDLSYYISADTRVIPTQR